MKLFLNRFSTMYNFESHSSACAAARPAKAGKTARAPPAAEKKKAPQGTSRFAAVPIARLPAHVSVFYTSGAAQGLRSGLLYLIRKQSDVARSLDCSGQRSLMLRAGSGDAAGKNLSSLGNVLSERRNILIINRLRVLRAENTDLSSSAHPAARSSASLAFRLITLRVRHDLVPFQSV